MLKSEKFAYFFPKLFLWIERMQFWLQQQGRNYFVQSPKKFKKFFFQKFVFPKIFHWTSKMQICQPSVNLFAENQKINRSKSGQFPEFYSKNFFHQNDLQDTYYFSKFSFSINFPLDTLSANLATVLKHFASKSDQISEVLDFSQKCWKCSFGVVGIGFGKTIFCLFLYLLC